jgi:hypothetical protein
MTSTRTRLLSALAEMSEMHPDWRLGQMIANLTFWSHNPKDATEAAAAIWDVEDEELINTIQDHLTRRRAKLQKEADLTPQSTS